MPIEHALDIQPTDADAVRSALSTVAADGFLALPVVDGEERLLGIITADDEAVTTIERGNARRSRHAHIVLLCPAT